MATPAAIPTLPENAPFTPEQRAWLNGFLAGLFHDRGLPAPAAADPAPAAANAPLLVAFGSQSGSAAGLAKRIAREAARHGLAATARELNAVTPAALAAAPRVLVVTSTWGDGEPPDNAAAFWSAIAADDAPRLGAVSYAVLGLGDRNYADFCGAARKIDERLAALGARRVVPRAECDVDYEAAANAWLATLWPALAPTGEATQTSGGTSSTSPFASAAGGTSSTSPLASTSGGTSSASPLGLPSGGTSPQTPPHPAPAFSRAHPYPARLKANRRLNGPGSSKDTRHLEILLGDSGLSYEAGDALGVMPRNCPALVEELLAALGLSGDEPVAAENLPATSLHAALLDALVITAPPPAFVREAAARAPGSVLAPLLDPARKADLDAWLRGRDVVDILRACPGARFAANEFAALLRRLQPRLYSISSSPKAHPGEVHLTVGTVRYEAHGRARRGVASCWLADRVIPGETPVPVFVQHSHGFRPPSDGSVPIVMVGPGTGIAPFRAFLEERRATGATGRNWLFFGDQRRSDDFLYSGELEPMHADGFLTRLDLAFSRDQEAKVYVQHRMEEHAAELWRWLEAGAHFYVCGDAKRMAKDVDAALHAVVAKAGGKSPDDAAAYVAALRAAKRYQRDVY